MYTYGHVHPPPTLPPLIDLFRRKDRSLLCFTYTPLPTPSP